MTFVMVPVKASASVDGEASEAAPRENRAVVQLRIARAVDDFQRGVDREASFGLVYTTYARALERIFRSRGLDAERCRDLTHETMRDVHRDLADYQSHVRFEAWLYQVARVHFPSSDDAGSMADADSMADAVAEDALAVEALFAYLSGELPPTEAMDVQDALADSPSAQAQLFELQILLDAAPPVHANAAASVASDLAAFQTNVRAMSAPSSKASESPSRLSGIEHWVRPGLGIAIVLLVVAVAMVGWLGRDRLGARPAWLRTAEPGSLSGEAAPQDRQAVSGVELLAGVPSVPVVAPVGAWLSVTLVTRQRVAPCTTDVSRGVGALGTTAADDRGTLGDLTPSAGKVVVTVRADGDSSYGFQLRCADGPEERYALRLSATGR